MRQSDYYDSNSSTNLSSAEMEKVQTLWKDIQQNRRQLEELQSSYQRDNHNQSTMSNYVTENNDLRDKLRISEKQLNDARDNIVILSRKLNEADHGLQSYQHHLAQQTGVSMMKTHQINRVTREYENINLSQKEIIERSRESNLALIHELDDKQRALYRNKDITRDTVEKLSVASVGYTQAVGKVQRLEEELNDKNREIANLKNDLAEAKRTIFDLQQVKKSEGLAMLEIEHLRSDTNRLVKMLRTTQEYQGFADFADDHAGSIRFMKDTIRKTNVDLNHNKTYGPSVKESVVERLCVKESLLDEKEMWIPHDASKFAREFRRTYNGEITDALMDKLLFELNRIWSKRENQRVQRIQSQCAHEIMKLKRKLEQTAPFNEVQAKQTINRLRGELTTSYKENRKAFDERMEKNPPGTHYVNETVRITKDAHRLKKQITQENQFLKDQLKASRSQSEWARSKDF